MKLQDFLKVSKVRCVSVGNYSFLTVAREYHVIGVYKDSAIVVNDNDDKGVYPYEYFEPVPDTAENPPQCAEPTPEFEAVDTNVSKPQFKVGAPVYWGLKSRIFKIHRFISTNVLEVELDGGVTSVRKDALCPANQENYEKLCSLFERIDFEQPPKELRGSDLARAMLERGDRRIYGYASDNSDNDPHGYECVVRDYDVNSGFGVIMSNARYEFFNPCDPRTGEPLTQAVLDE